MTKKMNIEMVAVDLHCIPKRLRALDPGKVDQLAKSMETFGLLHPITVWEVTEGDYEVVAGAHRLAAADKLDWDSIDAVFVDHMSETDRQLVEIDENLMRAELTPTQMAEHSARRKELWEARKNQVGKVCPPENPVGFKSPPIQDKGFAADTAAKTGMSKRAINLALSRANTIPEDVRDQIRGTDLDKGSYLDQLKKVPPENQLAQVQKDLGAPPKPSVKQDGFATLMRDWNKATDDERNQFLRWLNNTGKIGGMSIDEVVERLRWGLRDGRIRDEDRGAVMGILRQSKTGRWWPTPAQEAFARRLVDELTAEPVIDDDDGGDDG